MARALKLDNQHWQPDSLVFMKDPIYREKRLIYRAMIAAAVANEIIERMLKNAEDKKT
jgi:hypothetical protein